MADEQDQGAGSAGAGSAGAGDAGASGAASGSVDAGAQGAQGRASGAGDGAGQASSGFALPEAYKAKGWAAKVKSQDDLFKLIDNQDKLIGQKSIVPDFDKASPEEIEAYVSKLRPADKSAYKFGDDANPEVSAAVADIMHKAGIPAALGNKVIDGYKALERTFMEKRLSKEGLEAEWKKSFGESYQEEAGKTTNFIKEHLTAEDRKLFDSVPNEHLGLVYRLASVIKKAYGASEGKAGEAGVGSQKGTDVEGMRKGLRAKMADMKRAPHDAGEYQKLVDQLAATYK